MLPESTIRTIYRVAAEFEPRRSRPLLYMSWLADIISGDIWFSRQDISLVGGDPVTIALRLAREARQTGPMRRRRVAVIGSGGFSGAPLAALADPGFLASLRKNLGAAGLSLGRPDDAGGLASGLEPLGAAFGEPGHPPALDGYRLGEARRMIERLIGEARGLIEASGVELLYGADGPEAELDAVRGEVVLRLGRDRGKGRTRAVITPAAPGARGRDGGVAPAPAEAGSPSGTLLARSDALSRHGFEVLEREILALARRIPPGRRFADVVVSSSLEVLSGHVGPARRPGEDAALDIAGSRFIEEQLGADTYAFARRIPDSVEAALEMWIDDLCRAATGMSRSRRAPQFSAVAPGVNQHSSEQANEGDSS